MPYVVSQARKLGNGKEKAVLLREVTLRVGVSSTCCSSVEFPFPLIRDIVPRCRAGDRIALYSTIETARSSIMPGSTVISDNVLWLRWRWCAVVSEYSNSEIVASPLLTHVSRCQSTCREESMERLHQGIFLEIIFSLSPLQSHRYTPATNDSFASYELQPDTKCEQIEVIVWHGNYPKKDLRFKPDKY